MKVSHSLLLTLVALLAFTQSAIAQVSPVKWSIDKVENDGKIDVIITADILDKWKIYSNTTEEGGPIATDITFESKAQLSGDYREQTTPKSYQSDLFGMSVSTFAGQAIFVQTVENSTPGTPLTAIVTYMSCNDKQCLPPTDIELEITL